MATTTTKGMRRARLVSALLGAGVLVGMQGVPRVERDATDWCLHTRYVRVCSFDREAAEAREEDAATISKLRLDAQLAEIERREHDRPPTVRVRRY